MKLLGRIAAVLAITILVAAGVLCGWLYLYSADLPSISELNRYDPTAPSETQSRDNSPTRVIPTDQMGKYLLSAVFAAEGQPQSRGPIRATITALFSDASPRSQMYSMQIARGLVPPSRLFRRQIDELRLAEQIHRHFNDQQVLTIYLNRVYLGENTWGVEDGSIRYFGKHASDLSLDEAALLAGLIERPSYYSPTRHPDRAVERRNWVIDQMTREGSVSRDDAEKAKAAPLVLK